MNLRDGNGDLLADSCNILNSLKNYFCQLLNVYRINDVRQTQMHTTEPLVPDRSSFEDEIAIDMLKIYKTRGIDKLLAELIQVGGNTLRSERHELINSICNKEELPYKWKEHIIVAIYRKVIKLTVVIVEEYHCYQLHTKFFSSPPRPDRLWGPSSLLSNG
jgi:hypothetical protein